VAGVGGSGGGSFTAFMQPAAGGCGGMSIRSHRPSDVGHFG